jgi:predicted RNase H-like HicB family nuclease
MWGGDKTPVRYSLLIHRSLAGEAFLVTPPEREGRTFNPVTHADSYEQASSHALAVLEVLVELSIEHGEPLSAPQYVSAAT